jgi:chromosome segregation and condensation protein ScpB
MQKRDSKLRQISGSNKITIKKKLKKFVNKKVEANMNRSAERVT